MSTMLRTGWYDPVEPPQDCLRLLLCAWTAEPTGKHLLVPDACCDLLWLSSGRFLFCGPETTAWSFELPPGTTAVGVRFRPGVPSALFGLDLSRFREERVDAAEILGEETAASWARRIEAADGLAPRRDALTGLLRDHCAAGEPDPFAEAVLSRLTAAPHEDVRELAAALSVHPRTLHRRCLRLFGYAPSTLGRLVRLQRFLALAATESRPTLAGLAVGAGYVDQAHLGRECRRITGKAPAALLSGYFSTFPDMSDPYKSGRPFGASMKP
jgi:AraC-like DNA-binding protein